MKRPSQTTGSKKPQVNANKRSANEKELTSPDQNPIATAKQKVEITQTVVGDVVDAVLSTSNDASKAGSSSQHKQESNKIEASSNGKQEEEINVNTSYNTKADQPQVSAVATLTKLREEEKLAKQRSLSTNIETSFLQRPHPFIGIYMLCVTVVIFLVFATTAVERIELPLEETLETLRTQCFTLEEQYFGFPTAFAPRTSSSSSLSSSESTIKNVDAQFARLHSSNASAEVTLMGDVIRDFGDIDTSTQGTTSDTSVTFFDAVLSAITTGDTNAIQLQKYAAAAEAWKNGKQQPTKATLPYPLARHYRLSFNVLLLSNEHKNAHLEGLVADFDDQEGSSSASSTSDSGKSARSHREKLLVKSAARIVKEINSTVQLVKERVGGYGVGEESTVPDIKFHTEVATVVETALQSALLDNDVNLFRSAADSATMRSDFDDLEAKKTIEKEGQKTSQDVERSEQFYRAKLQKKEKAFIAKYYDSQNRTIDPFLRAAARVALTYDLPDRYRMPLPPGDGHPVQNTQISFIVHQLRKPNKTADSLTTPPLSENTTTIRCTLAGDENSHYACLVTIPYFSNPQSSAEEFLTSNITKMFSNAVGTIVAARLGVKDFKSETISDWKQIRSLQSCARSFAYLKRVVDLLEEHPRAAFPEELRPLWTKFLENAKIGNLTSAATTTLNLRMELAATYLHQILFHPSLIPEQTFPLEQLLVMYMPLLLPFVGAALQSFLTLVKYRKNERKKYRDAVLEDKSKGITS